MVFREKMQDGSTRISAGLSLSDIFKAVYPVGSIHMSTTNTNPATQFGGTWVAWGSGRVPVGVDTAQTEFDTVEETGGEKTHVLSAAEMPSHLHSINHDHASMNLPVTSISDATVANAAVRVTKVGTVGSTPSGSTTTNTVLNLPSYTGNSGSTGGDGAHNNLQPYITCYMWKRTA